MDNIDRYGIYNVLNLKIPFLQEIGNVIYVGGQRLLTLRNELRDVVATLLFTVSVFFSVAPLCYRGVFPCLLCHSTWSLAFLLWTEQLLKDVPHIASK